MDSPEDCEQEVELEKSNDVAPLSIELDLLLLPCVFRITTFVVTNAFWIIFSRKSSLARACSSCARSRASYILADCRVCWIRRYLKNHDPTNKTSSPRTGNMKKTYLWPPQLGVKIDSSPKDFSSHELKLVFSRRFPTAVKLATASEADAWILIVKLAHLSTCSLFPTTNGLLFSFYLRLMFCEGRPPRHSIQFGLLIVQCRAVNPQPVFWLT